MFGMAIVLSVSQNNDIGGRMDWENPLRSVAATVDADVLKVLAAAHDPVTGNQLARLAGRSYAQVYAVVGRMVEEGLVLTARYGRTNTFRLNRDHVLVQGILAVLAGPARLELEIKQAVQGWGIPPEMVALSGSAARRRTAADENIEVLVVRSDETHRDNPAWRGQIDALARRIEHACGNRVEIREMGQSEHQTAVSGVGPTGAARSGQSRTIFERRWAT